MGSKTVKEICQMLHISRRALQGYEKAGLVKPSGKNHYGHLLYDESTAKRIATISFYQQLHFSIKEISELVDADNQTLLNRMREQISVLEKKHALLTDVIERSSILVEQLAANPTLSITQLLEKETQ